MGAHWGHPYIDYIGGLEALYENVTMPKEINADYAGLLATDRAFKILHFEFRKTKRWAIDATKLEAGHPLKEFVDNQMWPTSQVIASWGDSWHSNKMLGHS